ncbi:hypothetical protein BJY00DRAFT_266741 [Aspergillus carlsbadensis]|nr:hypothetical protein BJY00DRAFT_266741 [Aspergillus carlsbadensis]
MSTATPQPTESQQICTPETWRSVLTAGSTKSWVLFEKGTIVILMTPTPDADLATQAIDILKVWGPVHVATPSADFNIIDLREEAAGGFVVTGHHNDVLNYVPADALPEGAAGMVAGLIGRGYRDEDAKGLRVVHVEDKRG